MNLSDIEMVYKKKKHDKEVICVQLTIVFVEKMSNELSYFS